MPTLEPLLNAYLTINAALLAAFAMWALSRAALRRAGLHQTHTTQLRLLYALITGALLAPLFPVLVSVVREAGLLPGDMRLTVPDLVLAHYLQGGFEMDAARLEQMLAARGRWTADMLALGSLGSKALALAFALGLGLAALRLVRGVNELRTTLRDSFAWRRIHRIDIRLSDTTTVPFSTRGLTRQYVVLPAFMLENLSDLRISLSHELQHMRQRDLEWEIALEALKPFFILNPAFHALKRQVERTRELACDQQVLARPRHRAADYANCLLRVSERAFLRQSGRNEQLVRVALIDTRQGASRRRKPGGLLRERVLSLSEGSVDKRANRLTMLVLIPAFAMTLMVSLAVQQQSRWSQDKLMLSTIINLERLEMRNSQTAQGYRSY